MSSSTTLGRRRRTVFPLVTNAARPRAGIVAKPHLGCAPSSWRKPFRRPPTGALRRGELDKPALRPPSARGPGSSRIDHLPGQETVQKHSSSALSRKRQSSSPGSGVWNRNFIGIKTCNEFPTVFFFWLSESLGAVEGPRPPLLRGGRGRDIARNIVQNHMLPVISSVAPLRPARFRSKWSRSATEGARQGCFPAPNVPHAEDGAADVPCAGPVRPAGFSGRPARLPGLYATRTGRSTQKHSRRRTYVPHARLAWTTGAWPRCVLRWAHGGQGGLGRKRVKGRLEVAIHSKRA